MPGFLAQNHFFKPPGNGLIGCLAPQERAQVVLGHAEQAGSNLAIGSEPDAVAVSAERFADGRNHSDLAAALRKLPAFGSRRWIIRRGRPQLKPLLDALEDFLA